MAHVSRQLRVFNTLAYREAAQQPTLLTQLPQPASARQRNQPNPYFRKSRFVGLSIVRMTVVPSYWATIVRMW